MNAPALTELCAAAGHSSAVPIRHFFSNEHQTYFSEPSNRLVDCNSQVECGSRAVCPMSTFTNVQPRFETERFTVVPLSPTEGRKLAEVLLQDEALAARIPWLTEKTQDGALREAYGIELQAAAGQLKVWGIVTRELRTQIGAIISRNSIEGIDVEVLVASQFWDDGVVEEVSEPVMDWLEDNSEVIQDFPINLH